LDSSPLCCSANHIHLIPLAAYCLPYIRLSNTVKVEMYNARKGPLQCRCFQRFGHMQHTCSYAPRCMACWDASVSPQSSSLSAAVAEETTLLTIKVTVSGRKQRRLLQSECKGRMVERMASPPRLSPEQERLGSGWNHIV
jgi:hypothetical protein